MKLEDYVGIDTQPTSYTEVYRTPLFEKAMNEYFDITDTETRRVLLSVNEADQTQMLVTLTGKLYDNIVEKVDDIDYGDIPATKGDITLLPNYVKLVNCLDIMEKILVEFKQDTGTVTVVKAAIENIKERKELFAKAFRNGNELPVVMYTNLVLAVISATSLLVSSTIEFIKSPSEATFTITVDKVGLAKSKQHMLYTNLDKFNKSFAKGDFDKAMNSVMSVNKTHRESAMILGNEESVNESIVATTLAISKIVMASTATVGLLLLIIPLLRELVFFFYYTRTRVSEYFDIQADLLQMNAYNLEYNDTFDNEQKKKIASKQFKIVDMFRKVANKFAITFKEGEVKATKDIVSENKKKYKTTDLMEEMPDSASTSLF